MIRIIAVRHGETDWNRIRRLQGHTDVPLNATGRAQADRLAAALAGEAIAAVHASDLSRAVATAEPVARRLGLSITRDARLRERDYGILEGRTFPEILAALPDEAEFLRVRDPAHTIPEGESQRTFFHRVVDAVSSIAEAASRAIAEPGPGTVAATGSATTVGPVDEPSMRGVADGKALLIVTHGGVLDMLHRAASGQPLDAERTWPTPNAVVNRLTYDRGRFAVIGWAEET